MALLYAAFGMTKNKAAEIMRRFDPEQDLQGAENVIAWSKNPDATIELDGKRFPVYAHLNILADRQLASIVRADRAGTYMH